MWRWSGVFVDSCPPIFLFLRDVMSYDHDSNGRHKKQLGDICIQTEFFSETY